MSSRTQNVEFAKIRPPPCYGEKNRVEILPFDPQYDKSIHSFNNARHPKDQINALRALVHSMEEAQADPLESVNGKTSILHAVIFLFFFDHRAQPLQIYLGPFMKRLFSSSNTSKRQGAGQMLDDSLEQFIKHSFEINFGENADDIVIFLLNLETACLTIQKFFSSRYLVERTRLLLQCLSRFCIVLVRKLSEASQEIVESNHHSSRGKQNTQDILNLFQPLFRVSSLVFLFGRDDIHQLQADHRLVMVEILRPFFQVFESEYIRSTAIPGKLRHQMAVILALTLIPWKAVKTSQSKEKSRGAVKQEKTNKGKREAFDIEERRTSLLSLHPGLVRGDVDDTQAWTTKLSLWISLSLIKGCFDHFPLSTESSDYLSILLSWISFSQQHEISFRYACFQVLETVLGRMEHTTSEFTQKYFSLKHWSLILTSAVDMWIPRGVQMFENIVRSSCYVTQKCGLGQQMVDILLTSLARHPGDHPGRYPILLILVQFSAFGDEGLQAHPKFLQQAILDMEDSKIAHAAGKFLLKRIHSDDSGQVLAQIMNNTCKTTDSIDRCLPILMHILIPFVLEKRNSIGPIASLVAHNPQLYFLYAQKLREKKVKITYIVDETSSEVIWGGAFVHEDIQMNNITLKITALDCAEEHAFALLPTLLSRHLAGGHTSEISKILNLIAKESAESSKIRFFLFNTLCKLQFPGSSTKRLGVLLNFWAELPEFFCAHSILISKMTSLLFVTLAEGWDQIRSLSFRILQRPDLELTSMPHGALEWAQGKGIESVTRKGGECAAFLMALASRLNRSEHTKELDQILSKSMTFLERLVEKQNATSPFFFTTGYHGSLILIRLLLFPSHCSRETEVKRAFSLAVRLVHISGHTFAPPCDNRGKNESIPSFIVDCRGHIIATGLSSGEQQRIVARTWLAVKESCNLISSITENYAETFDLPFDTAVSSLKFALLRSNHHGVMGVCRKCLTMVIRRCILSTTYRHVAEQALAELVDIKDAISRGKEIVLRRSQGLSQAIIAILDAESSLSYTYLTRKCVASLLTLLQDEQKKQKRNSKAFFEEDSIHRMQCKTVVFNILYYILEDTVCSRFLFEFIDDILVFTLRDIVSEWWCLRNSCIMVHAQLLLRIAGTQKLHRRMTYYQFRVQHERVVEHILSVVGRSTDSSVYLFLLLFTPLVDGSAWGGDVEAAKMRMAILDHIDSPSWLVRQTIAEVLPSFTDKITHRRELIFFLLRKLYASKKSNEKHGLLLAIRSLQTSGSPTWSDLLTVFNPGELLKLGPGNLQKSKVSAREGLKKTSISQNLDDTSRYVQPCLFIWKELLGLVHGIWKRQNHENTYCRVFLTEQIQSGLALWKEMKRSDARFRPPGFLFFFDELLAIWGDIFIYFAKDESSCVHGIFEAILNSGMEISNPRSLLPFLTNDEALRTLLIHIDSPHALELLALVYEQDNALRALDLTSMSIKQNLVELCERAFRLDAMHIPSLSRIFLLRINVLFCTSSLPYSGFPAPAKIEELCRKWNTERIEEKVRYPIVCALELLYQTSLKGMPYFSVTTCETLVDLLIDPSEKIRRHVVRVVLMKGEYTALRHKLGLKKSFHKIRINYKTGQRDDKHVQLEVALEHHFFNIIQYGVWVGREVELMEKLLPSRTTDSELEQEEEEPVFAKDPPHYFHEELYILQYYATVLRALLDKPIHNAVQMQKILSSKIDEWVKNLQRLPFKCLYGDITLWPEPWNALYRLLMVSWGLDALIPMSQSMEKMGIKSYPGLHKVLSLANISVACAQPQATDVLFLLSPHFLSQILPGPETEELGVQ